MTAEEKATAIADKIVPAYRAAGSHHSCTGTAAKMWSSAYSGALDVLTTKAASEAAKPEIPRLIKEQAAIIGAFTGILSGNFEDMHAYVEKIMGRPVFTHEMGDEAISEQIREAARADFKAILPEGTRGA